MIHIHYKGPEMPCLRIIEKCININTAVRRGNTQVNNMCKRLNSRTAYDRKQNNINYCLIGNVNVFQEYNLLYGKTNSF